MPKSVVITGATSGIGKALALRFAAERATLGLLGRDRRRLDEISAQCRELGAEPRGGLIDVRDRAQLAGWIEEFDTAFPVDLVVANAGITGGTAPRALIESAETSDLLMEINTLGVLNTVHPILPRMIARRRGQIAIMSSIAAFVPLPDAASYCASKAAILHYGLALRACVRACGIRVSVICPGYVATPMSQRTVGWKPFEMSAEAAVERICRGIERNKAIVAFPMAFALLARFGALLPDSLRRRALKPYGFKVTDLA